jgi:hypothetical protein
MDPVPQTSLRNLSRLDCVRTLSDRAPAIFQHFGTIRNAARDACGTRGARRPPCFGGWLQPAASIPRPGLADDVAEEQQSREFRSAGIGAPAVLSAEVAHCDPQYRADLASLVTLQLQFCRIRAGRAARKPLPAKGNMPCRAALESAMKRLIAARAAAVIKYRIRSGVAEVSQPNAPRAVNKLSMQFWNGGFK